jgi:hypothetical protein
MKITKKQLRQIINEALELHLAPDNLGVMDPELAYGDPGKDYQEEISIEDLLNALQGVEDESQYFSPQPPVRRSGG